MTADRRPRAKDRRDTGRHRSIVATRRGSRCLAAWIFVSLLFASPLLPAQTPPPATPAPATPPPGSTPSPGTSGGLQPAGDDVSVETSVAKETIQIADATTVEIRIDHPASHEIEELNPATIPQRRIEVLDVRQKTEAADDGRAETRIALTVRVLRIGRFYLDPIRIVLTDEDGTRRYVESEQVSIAVESTVLDDLSSAELRGSGPPWSIIEPDMRPIWIAAGVVGAGLLALALFLLIRRRRRHRRAVEAMEPIEVRDPWDVALERLSRIAEDGAPDDEKARRDVYYRLSEIIRQYLGARFRFESLELTTSELLARLDRLELPSSLDRDALEAFLLDCDLVKFARYAASDVEFDETIERARAVVEQTRPRPEAERTDEIDGTVELEAARVGEADDESVTEAQWMPPADYAIALGDRSDGEASSSGTDDEAVAVPREGRAPNRQDAAAEPHADTRKDDTATDWQATFDSTWADPADEDDATDMDVDDAAPEVDVRDATEVDADGATDVDVDNAATEADVHAATEVDVDGAKDVDAGDTTDDDTHVDRPRPELAADASSESPPDEEGDRAV